VHLERAEGARIHEHETRAVVEVEHGAREPRQLGIGAPMFPIAVHAKVHVHDAPVIQMKELVLAPSLNARDARADERTKDRGSHATPEGGMQQASTNDRAPPRAATQHVHGGFDFR
jgi:hypothetical protein